MTLRCLVFISYIQFNTRNIIFEYIDKLNNQLINNIVSLIKILKLWKK